MLTGQATWGKMAHQLEQLLTCCICLDRFRNPKLLPCQHSVCMEPCMEGLVDYVRRQVRQKHILHFFTWLSRLTYSQKSRTTFNNIFHVSPAPPKEISDRWISRLQMQQFSRSLHFSDFLPSDWNLVQFTSMILFDSRPISRAILGCSTHQHIFMPVLEEIHWSYSKKPLSGGRFWLFTFDFTQLPGLLQLPLTSTQQVKCPECRAEHRIPYNGVQGFPSNVTLQRFLEAHIEITGETPDPHTGENIPLTHRWGSWRCFPSDFMTEYIHSLFLWVSSQASSVSWSKWFSVYNDLPVILSCNSSKAA